MDGPLSRYFLIETSLFPNKFYILYKIFIKQAPYLRWKPTKRVSLCTSQADLNLPSCMASKVKRDKTSLITISPSKILDQKRIQNSVKHVR